MSNRRPYSARRDAGRRRRVQQPRAVEVQLQVELARRRHDVVDLVEPPAAPARRVVRVLDGDEPRARHVHRRAVAHQRADVVAGEAPGDGADRPRHEPAVHRRAALLREQDVRVLLGEQLVARLGEDPARDLVRHRRGRQVDRVLLPEQLGGAPLELEDGRVLALLLVADLGARHRLAHAARRLRRRIGAEIDHAEESTALTLCNRVRYASRDARRPLRRPHHPPLRRRARRRSGRHWPTSTAGSPRRRA